MTDGDATHDQTTKRWRKENWLWFAGIISALGLLVLGALARDLLSKLPIWPDWTVFVIVNYLAICMISVALAYFFAYKTSLPDLDRVRHALQQQQQDLERRLDTIGSYATLLTERLGEQGRLFTYYYEYPEFVASTQKRLFAEKGDNCGCIFLFGSMVGFSFTMPGALARHLSDVKTAFHHLKLLGVDVNRDRKDWFWYSTFLAANVVKEMLLDKGDTLRKLVKQQGHQLIIQIVYADHDVTTAAIDMPRRAVAVLQAQGPEGFKDAIRAQKDARRLLGFCFDDGDDVYQRYREVLENQWAYSKEKRMETWTIRRNAGGEIEIVFRHRHWTMTRGQGASLCGIVESEFTAQAAAPVEEVVGESDLVAFFTDLTAHIPQRNSDISDILRLVQDAKSEFRRKVGVTCFG